MRTLGLLLVVLPTTFGTVGCGFLPQPQGAAGYSTPQAVKDTARAMEAKGDAVTGPALDQELAKQQKDVEHALSMSLGKEGPSAGMPAGDSASVELAALRAAKFKLRIEPVTNQSGGAVADNFVQLKDSFTDRVQALQAKMVGGTATGAERAEIMSGAKQLLKLNNLKMQLGTVSRTALMTNTKVQNNGLSTMLQVAGMVSSRKHMEMDWNDEDYARVKKMLVRQKTWEAMAATTMGMLAAYEAVVSGQGDPKALDAIADASLKAFPITPDVSDEDVKNYVSHIGDDAVKQKAKYEGMMRTAYGDAVYEAQYKRGIDVMFDQAANAANTQTAGQMVAGVNSKYQDDLAKCARGEPLDSASLVGPAKCKEAAAGGGGGASVAGVAGGVAGVASGGIMGAIGGLFGSKGAVANVSAKVQVPGGASKAGGTVGKGVGVAEAMANGDAAGALQGAADMFPGDGPIQSSLQGVAALSKGDFKGALKSAIGLASLVPGGSLISQGLGAAGKLLGLFG